MNLQLLTSAFLLCLFTISINFPAAAQSGNLSTDELKEIMARLPAKPANISCVFSTEQKANATVNLSLTNWTVGFTQDGPVCIQIGCVDWVLEGTTAQPEGSLLPASQVQIRYVKNEGNDFLMVRLFRTRDLNSNKEKDNSDFFSVDFLELPLALIKQYDQPGVKAKTQLIGVNTNNRSGGQLATSISCTQTE